MTEQTTDNRELVYTAVPYLKVNRMQEHPYHEDGRHYCVMQKMTDKDGAFTGWKHASKAYEHSTSAYACLGRIVQRYINKMHPYLPDNER
jgi:hypothetical protein